MAWRRLGDKPFPQPVMTRSTDAYAGPDLNELMTINSKFNGGFILSGLEFQYRWMHYLSGKTGIKLYKPQLCVPVEYVLHYIHPPPPQKKKKKKKKK